MAENTLGTAAASEAQNLFQVEGDILLVRVHGTMQVEDIIAIQERTDELVARYGYVLVLANGQYTTGLSPAARKLQSENLARKIDPSYTAIYGASTALRLLSTLVQRGIALISGKSYTVCFTKSEQEARSILDTQRAILKKSATAPQ